MTSVVLLLAAATNGHGYFVLKACMTQEQPGSHESESLPSDCCNIALASNVGQASSIKSTFTGALPDRGGFLSASRSVESSHVPPRLAKCRTLQTQHVLLRV